MLTFRIYCRKLNQCLNNPRLRHQHRSLSTYSKEKIDANKMRKNLISCFFTNNAMLDKETFDGFMNLLNEYTIKDNLLIIKDNLLTTLKELKESKEREILSLKESKEREILSLKESKESEILSLKESKEELKESKESEILSLKESKDMALKLLKNVESEVLRSKQLLTSRGILEFILQKSFHELKQKNKDVEKFFKATNHAKYLDKNINENYTGKTFFIIYFCTFF